MRTIYKYPLEIVDNQTIQWPAGSVALDVQVQNGVPCLWAMVDPKAPPATVLIRTVGTGHRCDDVADLSMSYLGTYQIQGGALVFHVFAK